MDPDSLKVLDEVIRDQDLQWEAEVKDPRLRAERLRREYRADIGAWVMALVIGWAAAAVVATSFNWAFGFWASTGSAGLALASYFGAVVGILIVFTIVVIAVVLRRRTEYVAAISGPAPGGGPSGPPPTGAAPPEGPSLRRAPPPDQ